MAQFVKVGSRNRFEIGGREARRGRWTCIAGLQCRRKATMRSRIRPIVVALSQREWWWVNKSSALGRFPIQC